MPIHTTINERALRRTFREHKPGARGLAVYDIDLPKFGFRVFPGGAKTFFVRVVHQFGAKNIVLGTADEMTAAEARDKALATIAAANAERQADPLFADFVPEFMRRQGRRWKPSTREGNRHLIDRHLIPFFGNMRVPEVDRADVRRWFDSMSGTPGNANRTLPVLSVMMRQAELWDLRPQGSNPCRNMRRYKTTPRERFLSLDELKRLGFVLDHAEDRQAAAAIRLLLFTGARSSEITGLRWDWIRGARAVLPDSKTGPKAIQLPPPARAVLNGLPREGRFLFPNRTGDGPMKDLGLRWQKLRKLAGLDEVRIHDCRHTFASHAVMSGLDLYTVGRLLGHADVASTERYAHLADEHVREAAGRISGIVNDAIDHVRVSAWFDAASTDKPGAANRAFEILRAMLASARQWGELDEGVPDACANIVRNPRRPVARYLDHAELERLGTVLDRHREEHPWPVAAIRLLTLTGARLSEVIDLKWDEIGELGEDGASARLEDTKTGPRTIWLGPEAARLLAALPRTEGAARVFPEDLTSDRLYTFWVGVREEAGLPGPSHPRLPAHVGLAGCHERRRAHHRRAAARAPPARDHRHLRPSDDGALRDAASQAATVIARAMGYSAEPPPLPDEADDGGGGRELDWSHVVDNRIVPRTIRSTPPRRQTGPGCRTGQSQQMAPVELDGTRIDTGHWLAGQAVAQRAGEKRRQTRRLDRNKLAWM